MENENRIFFLTDAQPTCGSTDGDIFLKMMKDAAENKKIYSSLIGIGLDFDSKLVDYLTKMIRASNYFCIGSPQELKRTMDEDFDYNVTPTTFNVKLSSLDGTLKVSRIYGSPGFEFPAKGSTTILEINSLFPSAKRNGTETRGGVALLKLEPPTSNTNGQEFASKNFRLRLDYEDREGKRYEEDVEVQFPDIPNGGGIEGNDDYFENSGARKAVLLVRFVNMIHYCIDDAELRSRTQDSHASTESIDQTGICPTFVPDERAHYSQHRISTFMREKLVTFAEYFAKELIEIGDKELEKELRPIGLITTLHKTS